MQPIKHLGRRLADLADAEHSLFMPAELRALLPNLSEAAFKALLRGCEKIRFFTIGNLPSI